MSWGYSVGLALSLAVTGARAELPLAQYDKPEATLKHSTEVTFDPLGVAAVLHNPRASLSAARLYTQYDRKFFIWPHTMMMGATLIPVKVLVEHLTATFQSIHPAITLCTQDTQLLPVVSNMVFKEFPLDFSNMWLGDVIAYKSSAKPANDFMIVCMDDNGDRPAGPSKRTQWIGCSALNLTSLVNGLIIVAGIVLGVLSADIWALTLFFFYGTHWLAGLAISTTSLVTPQKMDIKEDDTTRYAIYQRPAGGTVVFKGRQDTMEAWARSTWEFSRTTKANCLHWFWVCTGTLSAICSVACMVNMFGYMQLAFLALLVYASLAEIGATRIARILQGETQAFDRTFLVYNNEYRTKGVIRATIEVDQKYRLSGLDWVSLKRMPSDEIFQDMQKMLTSINRYQEAVEGGREVVPHGGPRSHPLVDTALREFGENKENRERKENKPEDPILMERIQRETLEALHRWWLNQDDTHSSTEKKVEPHLV